MAKNLKKELDKYRRKYGLQERIPCSKEDNEIYLALLASGQELPEGVGRYKLVDGDYLDTFYTIQEEDLNPEERQEYLRFQALDWLGESKAYLRTIKNCAVFFTTLTIIALVVVTIAVIAMRAM